MLVLAHPILVSNQALSAHASAASAKPPIGEGTDASELTNSLSMVFYTLSHLFVLIDELKNLLRKELSGVFYPIRQSADNYIFRMKPISGIESRLNRVM